MESCMHYNRDREYLVQASWRVRAQQNALVVGRVSFIGKQRCPVIPDPCITFSKLIEVLVPLSPRPQSERIRSSSDRIQISQV